jgi:hypothetical protein
MLLLMWKTAWSIVNSESRATEATLQRKGGIRMGTFRIVSWIVVASCLTLPVFAQQARQSHGDPWLWQDRGSPAELDLTAGSGGKAAAPGMHFQFIKESMAGTSPKFDVEDENGTKWKVKLGEEVKSETAASRLVWAAGYFVDDDYYRPQIQVQGLKHLARGQQFVNGDVVTGVRLERVRKGDDPEGWSWYDNSFSGTREFNGLKVMMALINMWDLKQVNNSSMNGQYRVADLGATFGNTGNSFTRSKGVMKDYVGTKFIDKVTPQYVDFVMHSRPFFMTAVTNFRNYQFRTRMQTVVKRIPIADARWIGSVLGQLSSTQIQDAFRAAGFSPAEVDGYCRTVMLRIEELKKL